MGRRGPPPLPTKLHLVHGNPGKRPLNKREPQPKRIRPRRPRWLTGEGHRHWRELVRLLESMGVLTEADGRALARYCRLLTRWVSASGFIDEHGEVYPIRNKAGKAVSFRAFPQVRIIDSLSSELLPLLPCGRRQHRWLRWPRR